MGDKALVLFSGGLDSTTALCWARQNFQYVTTLVINYGQKHCLETVLAREVCERLAVPCLTLHLPLDRLLRSALLQPEKEIPESLAAAKEGQVVPPTYVPFRNGIFLALAAAYGESQSIFNLVTGFNRIDTPDYPDTSGRFARRMQRAINAGTSAARGGQKIRIHTPLLRLRKSEIITLGMKLGADYAYSLSCYRGGEIPCHRCPACEIRDRAFAELGIEDPLVSRLKREQQL